jgi:hypothetical protein
MAAGRLEMRIELKIDRLVLDGLPVDRSQSSLVKAAVEEELSRLLTRDGVVGKMGADAYQPYLRGEEIAVQRGEEPQGVGRRIARAVYGEIGR